jgi:RNA polymerase sigma-70 factor, ECF subfamily
MTKAQIQAEYELVKAAQQNPRRFDALYRRYHEAIFGFVFKRTRDEELSADLTSQIFLKAMTHLKKYRFKGVPFKAWLFTLASNEVNQFFRQNQKQRVISLDSANLKEMSEEVEGDATDENIRCMVAALDRLSLEEVQLIEFRFFEKIPFKEVAAIYGISESNAKVRLHRLLKKLKQSMQKEYQLNG